MRTIKVLFILIIGMILVSCSLRVEDNLAKTSWILDSWANEILSPSEYGITLELANNNEVYGNSSVNGYGSTYKIGKNNGLAFSKTASTLMASTDENRNKAETIYMKLLSEVQYYETIGDKLILKNKEKSVIMTFNNVQYPSVMK